MGGLVVELRKERGLDVGAVSLDGTRLDWAGTQDLETRDVWLASFRDGLVVTCGLHNVGVPSDGWGTHGSFALTAARDVVESGGTATGLIVDGVLECRRRVAFDEEGRIEITDVVTNASTEPVQAPMLYHVNWGDPIFGPGAYLHVQGTKPDRGGAPWGELTDGLVIEHGLDSALPLAVTLANPRLGLTVTISWTGLDRLFAWVAVHRGTPVLSIEPANCSVLGRKHDRLQERAPMLAARESRTTSLTIELERTETHLAPRPRLA